MLDAQLLCTYWHQRESGLYSEQGAVPASTIIFEFNGNSLQLFCDDEFPTNAHSKCARHFYETV